MVARLVRYSFGDSYVGGTYCRLPRWFSAYPRNYFVLNKGRFCEFESSRSPSQDFFLVPKLARRN